MIWRPFFFLTVPALALVFAPAHLQAGDEPMPLILSEDFEKADAFAPWFPTQKDMWTLADTGSAQGRALRIAGKSAKYNPPFRSPHSIALLKDKVLGDFVLTARVQTLQDSRGHRDMCIFWGWQDDAHFYYVHLGETPDPHSSQIFIVKNAPRTAITRVNKGGVPWQTGAWHDVKLVRKAAEGLIEVYFDDMTTPLKTANDTTFQWGMIGLGTFDDLGLWDDVKINGVEISGKTPALPTPERQGETVQSPPKKKDTGTPAGNSPAK